METETTETNNKLFGSSDDEHSDNNSNESSNKQELFGSESEHDAQEDIEDNDNSDKETNTREKVEIDISLPPAFSLKRPSTGSRLLLATRPSFLQLDPRVFTPQTFDIDSDYEDDQSDHEHAAAHRRLNLSIQNTIRWRFKEDATTDNNDTVDNSDKEKESNARFIKWSDGTYTLLVGSEMFEMTEKVLSNNHQFISDVFLQQGLFRTQARLDGQVGFRPFSTSSATHKKLTASVLAKHQKVNKTKFIGALSNPEAQKIEMEKLELEKIRNRKKLEAKRKNQGTRYGEMTADDLEEEEEEAMRSSSYRRQQNENGGEFEEDYDDDFVVDDNHVDYDEDDDELEEAEAEDRILNAKRGLERGDGVTVKSLVADGGDEDQEEEEDDEEEGIDRVKARRRMVMDEDDE